MLPVPKYSFVWHVAGETAMSRQLDVLLQMVVDAGCTISFPTMCLHQQQPGTKTHARHTEVHVEGLA